MLFDVNTTWKEIYDAIMGEKKAAALLKAATFIDEYRGKQVPKGKKSVTIRLTIGSMEKTLTSKDIEKTANQTLAKLSKKVGGELRTQ
jgi:phenylalanyl-tRNA synthetase beta chain